MTKNPSKRRLWESLPLRGAVSQRRKVFKVGVTSLGLGLLPAPRAGALQEAPRHAVGTAGGSPARGRSHLSHQAGLESWYETPFQCVAPPLIVIGCWGRGQRAARARSFSIGGGGGASPEADGGGGGGALGRPGLRRSPQLAAPAARGAAAMQPPPSDPLGDCLRDWEDLQQDFQSIQVGSTPATH